MFPYFLIDLYTYKENIQEPTFGNILQIFYFAAPDNEQVLCELVVSDSLCCSYCNTEFEDKTQQRLHYKLDWHRYNLKQHLNGLKSISEDNFNKLAGEGTV